jgi:hypothetical protein
MLKNVSELTFVPTNIFFLRILKLVQSFVECKVSLADGNMGVTSALGSDERKEFRLRNLT